MVWIYLIQNKNKLRDAVDAVMNLRVPQNARNFLIRRGSVSFSRRTLLQGFSYIYYIVLVRPHLFPVLRTESDSQRSVQTRRGVCRQPGVLTSLLVNDSSQGFMFRETVLCGILHTNCYSMIKPTKSPPSDISYKRGKYEQQFIYPTN